MRKFIILSLFGLTIITFSSSANAQTLEFRASGLLDMITFLERNTVPGAYGNAIYSSFSPPFKPPGWGVAYSGAWNKTNSWVESRGLLKFEAIMDKEVTGTIYFEMDSTRWGEEDGTRNKLGYWGTDRAGVEVKNLFITFRVPAIPIPVTVQAGLLPLAFRPAMVVYNDGAGVSATVNVDPATIKLVWFKAVEGEDFASDDVDVYGIDTNVKVGTLTVGGFALNYHMNQYPFANTAIPTSTVNYRGDMWWLGLYTQGKLGPVNLVFDLVYDTGKVEDHRDILVKARDVKYRGWATKLKVEYPWEKFNFGTTFLYASGADQKKTSESGLPGTLTPWSTNTTKVGGYVTPPGEEFGAFGESLVVYGSWANRSELGMFVFPFTTPVQMATRGAIGGTWFAKLFAGYKATPWYKVSLEVLYIGDTTKHGNTLGDAKKASLPRDDKTIGWEFDLIHEINIYKNLKWNIGFGLLLAGDALDQSGGASGPPSVSPKNPWVISTRLVYNF